MSDKQHIAHERAPHKYFTSLPNIYDDVNLSRLEHRLLTHYARVGSCHESVRTTSKRCKMGVSSVIAARESLKDKGWITVEQGDRQTLEIRVVDVWEINSGVYGGTIDEPQKAVSSLSSVSELKQLLYGVSESERGDSDLKRNRFKSETKEDLSKKTIEEEEDGLKKISQDQTPLAQAKAAILTDLNGGKMYARKPEIFELVFEPLRTVATEFLGGGEEVRVVLDHPEPDIFDSRLKGMLEQGLMRVHGRSVVVQIDVRDA